MDNAYIIRLKLEDYKDMFYEFDYRPFSEKDVSDEVNTFILSRIQDIVNLKRIDIMLEIYISKSNYSKDTEAKMIQGIENYYDSKIIYDDNISKFGFKRLIYYFTISIICMITWYICQSIIGDQFITTILDTAATVILWQAMTMIFIESKNYSINKKVNKLFSTMKINVKYDE